MHVQWSLLSSSHREPEVISERLVYCPYTLTQNGHPSPQESCIPTRTCRACTRADSRPSSRGTCLSISLFPLPQGSDLHPDQFPSIRRNPRPLPDNLARPHQILQHLLVNGGEGTGSGTLLLCRDGGVSLGFGQDSTLGEEDDVFVGKLLLELSGEPNNGRSEVR